MLVRGKGDRTRDKGKEGGTERERERGRERQSVCAGVCVREREYVRKYIPEKKRRGSGNDFARVESKGGTFYCM